MNIKLFSSEHFVQCITISPHGIDCKQNWFKKNNHVNKATWLNPLIFIRLLQLLSLPNTQNDSQSQASFISRVYPKLRGIISLFSIAFWEWVTHIRCVCTLHEIHGDVLVGSIIPTIPPFGHDLMFDGDIMPVLN